MSPNNVILACEISQTTAVLVEEPFGTSRMVGSERSVTIVRTNVKAKSLLDKFNSLIVPDKNGDKKRIRNLSTVLHALGDSQQQLLEQLKEAEDDNVRRTILLKLEVIKRQQEKGAEAYRVSRARLEG